MRVSNVATVKEPQMCIPERVRGCSSQYAKQVYVCLIRDSYDKRSGRE
jgi:hypothetical protein